MSFFKVFEDAYIEFKQASGGGLKNGIPVKVEGKWVDKQACHIHTNTRSNKGRYKDGEFKIEQYTIFLNRRECKEKMVKLTDKTGVSLGEFEVLNIAYLTHVGRLKIAV